MKKRLLSTLLALCMALALFPVTALAADTDFVISDKGFLLEYRGPGGAVTIPGNVTIIGTGEDSVFSGDDNVTSVTISDGVTAIGQWAFDGCTSLTSITLPTSITHIDSYAFDGCSSLADVYYAGSESQWGQIYIGFGALLNATIHYNSTGPDTSAPDGISVTVGGNAVVWSDAAPFIDENNRTMVPLRAVADAMSLTVSWDGGSRIASFSDGSKTIDFPIDSDIAHTSDGDDVYMDTAAVIVNERTYAPIRYLAEYFGYEVGWDAATRTVTIK